MSSEADLTQGVGSPDNIDLTQDGQKWPVVAENWPVSPINTGEAAEEQTEEDAADNPLGQKTMADDDTDQTPVMPEETDPKAVIRVFDDKEVGLTRDGGQPVFEEARELQRQRVAQMQEE